MSEKIEPMPDDDNLSDLLPDGPEETIGFYLQGGLFTWEDVDDLSAAASRIDGFQAENGRLAGALAGLADRIASLLPPREP